MSPVCAQAKAVWQWWNFYETHNVDGQPILRINLDETSVCVFQGGARGTVFVSKKRCRATLKQAASRKERRSFLTHVAVICDRPEIQRLMPQFIIGNAAVLRASDMVRLRGACPSNVLLVRQKSAWNNEALCAKIIRRIGLAVGGTGFQPVLIMDAAKLHLTKGVFTACETARMWPLVIPPQMTFLLQPLDTHAFLPFKHALREAHLEAATSSVFDGGCGVLRVIGCVCEAVRLVLESRSWERAFDEAGFCAMQSKLGARVLKELSNDDLSFVPVVPHSKPPPHVVLQCFPRRFRVDVAMVWMAFDNAISPHESQPILEERAVANLARGDAFGRARGRTRSATYGANFAWASLVSRARKKGAVAPARSIVFVRFGCRGASDDR